MSWPKFSSIQPLKGPDPVPEAFGACIVCGKSTSDKNYMDKPLCADCSLYGKYAKAKAATPEPEQRYVIVPVKREDMVFVMELPWRIVCACPSQAVAQRIADLLAKDDSTIPF